MNGAERSNDGVVLKKCPFCGGDNVSLWYNRSISPLIPSTCEVHCYDCHFGLAPSKTKEEAIKAWNNRKPLERVIEMLETEGKLADEERDRCARENPLHFDTAKGYATGIYKAIEIIKEGLE